MIITKDISRRSFLKVGLSATGGLLLSASLGSEAAALGEDTGFKPNAYIEIAPDGRITFIVGKSEMGQGTLTGIAQLLADELECDWQQIHVQQSPAAAEFGIAGNGLMITGGSGSIVREWQRMREMGALARTMLLHAAANKWGVSPASVSAKAGIITGADGQTASYGELAPEAAALPIPEAPALKTADQRTFIGESMKRVDTWSKITGQAGFGIDVSIPGMVTAVLIHPPQFAAPVASFDASEALKRPGVQSVHQISSGVAIVADHYWTANSARDDIDVVWGDSPFAGIGMTELRAGYQAALSEPGLRAEETGNVDLVSGHQSVELEFEQPFLAHACMEPMTFTVAISDGTAEVWGPTQAQSFVQNTVAQVAGIDPAQVKVNTTFLGGGFGRRIAQDFVQAAAEIALATGKPVKLVYSREDDMRAARYRPFSLTRASGTLDAEGALVALDVKIAVPSVSTWSGLAFLVNERGIDGQAVEGLANLPYDIPNRRVDWVNHDTGIPVHFWRAVGASHNPFVIETLIDELARRSDQDPMAFRRRLLHAHPRFLTVLDRLSDEAGWQAPKADGIGRGMAIVKSFGTIVAEAVELRLVDGTPEIDKVTCVVDCGVAVNPGQVEAQMQSSIVYGISAFLRGQITMVDGMFVESNFHDYEPLRLYEMPEISVTILQNGEIPGGVGEPGLPPILPAIGNALRNLGEPAVTRLPYLS
jgi:isoquinoline 1-oxidoreductase beta subunit